MTPIDERGTVRAFVAENCERVAVSPGDVVHLAARDGSGDITRITAGKLAQYQRTDGAIIVDSRGHAYWLGAPGYGKNDTEGWAITKVEPGLPTDLGAVVRWKRDGRATSSIYTYAVRTGPSGWQVTGHGDYWNNAKVNAQSWELVTA